MFALIFTLLVRSAIILGAAELARRLSARSAPAARHRLVLWGFALLLLWPLAAATIPEVQIPVTHAVRVSAGTVTIHQNLFVVGGREPAWMTYAPLLLWAVGALIALLPLAIGYARVRISLRRAQPLQDSRWLALLREECERMRVPTQPDLLILAKQTAPFTFGLRGPKIVLPRGAEHWSTPGIRAVLAHELAHIERRDLIWQAFAHIVCALWWFQPLCWCSRYALRRESERACDAVALESGMRASEYARELLKIAQQYSTRWSGSYAALTMARRGELENRLWLILDPRTPGAKRFPWAAVAGMTALTLTASAVTIPGQSQAIGGHHMKRTILSGLLASAGLSAATIGGSVFDPAGAAVAQAQAQLTNPDTSVKQEAITSADGKFVFENLAAGSYILRVNKEGFDPVYRVFNVSQDATVQRGLVMGTKAENPVDPADPKLIRIGGVTAQANLITKVQPAYPQSAKDARLEGTVEMSAVISKEGVPLDIRVLRSPSEDMTAATLEAVRQWRYKPVLLNGQPTDVLTDIIVNFTLLPQ